MQSKDQSLEEVIDSLSPLAVDWMDDKAAEAIATLSEIPQKASYSRSDIEALLDAYSDEAGH